MKNFLLFLILGSTSLFAETYTFYVENPEMVSLYYNVFTAMKEIFGTNTYYELLKFLFLVGGFFTFAAGIFNGFGNNMNGVLSGYAKYILAGTALLIILFSSTSTLWIISQNSDVYCTSADPHPASAGLTVEGFPTVLGAVFNFINKASKYTLDVIEETYIGPSDTLSMRNGGYNHSIRDAMGVLSFDLSMDTNNSIDNLSLSVRSFMSQCIVTPFSAKGTEGYNQIVSIKSSGDIYSYLEDLYVTTNPEVGGIAARDYSLTMNGEVWTCGEFYDAVKPGLEEFKDNSLCFSRIDEGALSLIVGGGTMPPSSTFSDVALQSGLIYELEGSMAELGTGISGIGFATGKSRGEAMQTYLAQGQYMSEMLPTLQMTLRAIVFAFFPFVFLIILLPGGFTVLKNYFMTLIWIELWTPVAGIINMFLNQNVSNKFQDIYGGSGITLMSSIDMLSAGATISGVAGYLYASVPALTWAIVSGSSQMLEGIGKDLSLFMQKNIQTESMNIDKQTMAKRQEVSARAGKDLSMAEMMHYEAIQDGRVEGARLGTQMKAGMGAVLGTEVMNESSKLQEYSIIKQETGMTDIDIGTGIGNLDGKENLSKVNAGVKLASGDGVLTDNARTSSKMEEDRIGGEIDGDAERTISKHESMNAKINQNINQQTDSQLIDQVGANAVFQSSLNKKSFDQAYNQLMNAGVGSEAAKNFLYDQATTTSEKKELEEVFGKNAAEVKGLSQALRIEGTVAKQSAEQAVANLMSGGDRTKMLRTQAIGRMSIASISEDGTRSRIQTFAEDKDGNAVRAKAETNAVGMTTHRGYLRQALVDIGTLTVSGNKHSDIAEERRQDFQRKLGILEELRGAMKDFAGIRYSVAGIVASHYANKLLNNKKKINKMILKEKEKSNKSVLRKLEAEVARISTDIETLYKKFDLDDKNHRKAEEEKESKKDKRTKEEKAVLNNRTKELDSDIEKKRDDIKSSVKKEEDIIKIKNENIKSFNKKINEERTLTNKDLKILDDKIKAYEKYIKSGERRIAKLEGKENLTDAEKKTLVDLKAKVEKYKGKILLKKEDKFYRTSQRDAKVASLNQKISNGESNKLNKLNKLKGDLDDINNLKLNRINIKDNLLKKGEVDVYKNMMSTSKIDSQESIEKIISQNKEINNSELKKLSDKKIGKEMGTILEDLKKIDNDLDNQKDIVNQHKSINTEKLSNTDKVKYNTFKENIKNLKNIKGSEETIKNLKKDLLNLEKKGLKGQFKDLDSSDPKLRGNAEKLYARAVLQQKRELKHLSDLNSNKTEILNKANKKFNKFKDQSKKRYSKIYNAYKTDNERINRKIEKEAKDASKKYTDDVYKDVDNNIKASSESISKEFSDIQKEKKSLSEAKKYLKETKFDMNNPLEKAKYDNEKIRIQKMEVDYGKNLSDLNIKKKALDEYVLEIDGQKRRETDILEKEFKVDALSRVERNSFSQDVYEKEGFIKRKIREQKSKNRFKLEAKQEKNFDFISKEEMNKRNKTVNLNNMKMSLLKTYKAVSGVPLKAAISVGVMEAGNRIETTNTLAKVFTGSVDVVVSGIMDVISNPVEKKLNINSSIKIDNAIESNKQREKNALKEIRVLKEVLNNDTMSKTERSIVLISIGELKGEISSLEQSNIQLNVTDQLLEKERRELSSGPFSSAEKTFNKSREEIRKSSITGGFSLNDNDSIVGQVYDAGVFLKENVSAEQIEALADYVQENFNTNTSVAEFNAGLEKKIENLLVLANNNSLSKLNEKNKKIAEIKERTKSTEDI